VEDGYDDELNLRSNGFAMSKPGQFLRARRQLLKLRQRGPCVFLFYFILLFF